MSALTVTIAIYAALAISAGMWLHGYLRQRQLETRFQRQLQEMEKRLAASSSPTLAPVRDGLNWTLRTQILRLHRRGEKPETIAALTGAAPIEVEFTLKIAQLPAQLFELSP
jgi:uncharacterized protein HemX